MAVEEVYSRTELTLKNVTSTARARSLEHLPRNNLIGFETPVVVERFNRGAAYYADSDPMGAKWRFANARPEPDFR
jgi:hypothetical protein